MRYGEHWTGYPPDDPPESNHWCSACERDAEDCVCEELSDHLRETVGRPADDVCVPASVGFPLQLMERTVPRSFPEWLEAHGDYLPLPNSFREWLDRGNDAIRQANRDEAYLDQGHLHT